MNVEVTGMETIFVDVIPDQCTVYRNGPQNPGHILMQSTSRYSRQDIKKLAK